MPIPYPKTYFLLSAADVKQLPKDEGIEVAIVGRSNSGKSSVLNRITQNKKLARVSKTPGRTQHINMFIIDEKRRIADLPGYGYAKAPPKAKAIWRKAIEAYFQTRTSLKGLVLVMDIRHPLKELDKQMLEFCETKGLNVHILLNKQDKLNKNEVKKTQQEVNNFLTHYTNSVTVQGFSALNANGLKELISVLDSWFQPPKQ